MMPENRRRNMHITYQSIKVRIKPLNGKFAICSAFYCQCGKQETELNFYTAATTSRLMITMIMIFVKLTNFLSSLVDIDTGERFSSFPFQQHFVSRHWVVKAVERLEREPRKSRAIRHSRLIILCELNLRSYLGENGQQHRAERRWQRRTERSEHDVVLFASTARLMNDKAIKFDACWIKSTLCSNINPTSQWHYRPLDRQMLWAHKRVLQFFHLKFALLPVVTVQNQGRHLNQSFIEMNAENDIMTFIASLNWTFLQVSLVFIFNLLSEREKEKSKVEGEADEGGNLIEWNQLRTRNKSRKSITSLSRHDPSQSAVALCHRDWKESGKGSVRADIEYWRTQLKNFDSSIFHDHNSPPPSSLQNLAILSSHVLEPPLSQSMQY